jgi:hypothetical protein
MDTVIVEGVGLEKCVDRRNSGTPLSGRKDAEFDGELGFDLVPGKDACIVQRFLNRPLPESKKVCCPIGCGHDPIGLEPDPHEVVDSVNERTLANGVDLVKRKDLFHLARRGGSYQGVKVLEIPGDRLGRKSTPHRNGGWVRPEVAFGEELDRGIYHRESVSVPTSGSPVYHLAGVVLMRARGSYRPMTVSYHSDSPPASP